MKKLYFLPLFVLGCFNNRPIHGQINKVEGNQPANHGRAVREAARREARVAFLQARERANQRRWADAIVLWDAEVRMQNNNNNNNNNNQ